MFCRFERQYKKRLTVLTGRQITHQIFAFFDINKTQGGPMRMTELLNIELHNDSLKQFNQARREMIMSLDKNMDEEL